MGNQSGRKFIITAILALIGILMVLAAGIHFYKSGTTAETTVPATSSAADAGQNPSFIVHITEDGTEETIHPQWSDDDCIIYLPSFAANAEINILAEDSLTIDDVPAADAGALLDTGSHTLESQNREYTLTVYTSDNVGTIFINTESKSMDAVYADPSYKERIDISVFTKDGTIDYRSEEDKIKLRGNSTSHLEKRPFTLKLDSRNSLLGLRAAKEFALIASAYDRSGLRDVLYKELSREMGFAYSADTEYADVYLNGEYNGLYVLSEKISVSEEYLDLEEGSFLCAIELIGNIKEGDVYVDSTLQDIFEVSYPKDPSDEELTEIEEYLNSFERALAAENGIDSQSGKSWDEMIDLESWAKGYIIDEVSANTDSCLASSYLYYNAADGRLYKGPIWDGDRTFGNQISNENPRTFMASQGHGFNGDPTVFYSYLLEKDEFREKVKELYQNYDFQSMLTKLVDDNSSAIRTAKEIDSIRWDAMYDQLEEKLRTTVIDADDIKEYIKARVSYLDETIPHLENYAVIQIYEKGIYYRYYTVKKGEVFTPEDPAANYTDLDTGAAVDFSQPVYENIAAAKTGS